MNDINSLSIPVEDENHEEHEEIDSEFSDSGYIDDIENALAENEGWQEGYDYWVRTKAQ